MIGHVRGRAAFQRLRTTGARARSGVVWCTFVLDPVVSPPQVGFAIGRAVGSAVTRNRVRRRLRALLDTEHADLQPGLYLFGVTPGGGQRSFSELAFDLATVIRRTATKTSPAKPL